MTRVLGEAMTACALAAPLAVRGADVASEALTLWGDGWSFSTMSNWRLSRGGRLVAASVDEPDAVTTEVVGKNLLRLLSRTGTVADDPVLVFDDDLVLEVFADIGVEPWVLRLPGHTYVPSDLHDSRV